MFYPQIRFPVENRQPVKKQKVKIYIHASVFSCFLKKHLQNNEADRVEKGKRGTTKRSFLPYKSKITHATLKPLMIFLRRSPGIWPVYAVHRFPIFKQVFIIFFKEDSVDFHFTACQRDTPGIWDD